MTIDLPPELETSLHDEAAKEGLATDRFVIDTLRERLSKNHPSQNAPRLSRAEAELMQRINEGLPVETWRQYHALIAERDAGTLTAERQHVLVGLIDQVEIAHARRLSYLLELAHLRETNLDAVIDTLGIVKPTYV